MSRLTFRLLVTALALALLAACSQPPPSEPQPYTASGAVYGHEGATYPPIAASILVVDPQEAFGPEPESLIEVVDGVYVGEMVAIGSDGVVTLVFPDGDELPAAVLKPAQSILDDSFFGLTCDLVASDANARAIAVGIQGLVFYPTVLFYSIAGAAPGVALAGESSWPPASEAELEDLLIQTWTYADAPVAVSTGPELCGDISSPPVLRVDLDLQAGWNQLEWVYIFDEDTPVGLELRNSTADELHFFYEDIFD